MSTEKILPRPFNLDGKVAIVTGGSGLLGFQHARALLQIGAKVVLADIDFDLAKAKVEKLNVEFGSDHVSAIKLDVTSEESISHGLNTIIAELGSVDVLINNAAVNPAVNGDSVEGSSRLENFNLDQWNYELSVGLTGAFLCSRIFGGAMADSGGGVILNISSDLSVIAPDQRIYSSSNRSDSDQPVKPVTYSVIKTGLIGLTRYLATYWRGQAVRVNALSPGGVYLAQSVDFQRRLEGLIPLGRMAKEDEYVSAVQFLCSDASSYMTGQNVVIDGGRSVW